MKSELLRRVQAVRQALKRQHLHGILLTSPISVAYLSGAKDILWALVGLNDAFVMPSRLSDYSVRAGLRKPWRILDWRDPGKRLLDISRRLGIRRLAIEAGSINVSHYRLLRRRLEGAVLLIESNHLVESLREIKNKMEQRTLAAAGRISSEISRQLCWIIKPGVSERAVAAEIDRRMRALGADGPAFETIVLAGSRTVYPHGRPGDRRFTPGDLCLVDFGAKVDGFCSDITRVYCVPPAGDLQRKRYIMVRRAYLAARRMAKPGVSCGALDRAARRALGKDEEHFIHGLGHGVGMEIHESPRLGAGEKTRLKAGHVVTIEPGIYYPGWGAIRLEDTVVITESGCESLTGELSKDLPLVGRNY